MRELRGYGAAKPVPWQRSPPDLDRVLMATLHRKMAAAKVPALTCAAFRTLLWPPNGAGMACSVVRFAADFSGLTIP